MCTFCSIILKLNFPLIQMRDEEDLLKSRILDAGENNF